MKNLEQTAKSYGCTVDQLRKQYKANYMGFSRMLLKARKTGKKVNGFTEEQLQKFVSKYCELAGMPLKVSVYGNKCVDQNGVEVFLKNGEWVYKK